VIASHCFKTGEFSRNVAMLAAATMGKPEAKTLSHQYRPVLRIQKPMLRPPMLPASALGMSRRPDSSESRRNADSKNMG
jgi:hypothetical protein